MVDTYTEGPRAGEFRLSRDDAMGSRTVENGTVAQGQNLVAGQLVMLSGGKLVAQDGELTTDGELVTKPCGIVIDNVNASSTGSNADTPAAYVARDEAVKGPFLTFPDETTDGDERALCVAALAELGIIVRD